MNIKNFLTLTIRVKDYNLVRRQPELVKELRKLTLYPQSGMNHCLDNLERRAAERMVDCKILLAYRSQELVAWALLSKEATNYSFINSGDGYYPSQGTLFQVYVNPAHRRQGIASELLKVARRKAGASRLCVCPWDTASEGFYQNYSKFHFKRL